MTVWEMLLMAVGVSLDALAVSLAAGAAEPARRRCNAALAALFFGGFQFFMPVLGACPGELLRHFQKCDHWIAFALLAVVGGKMIVEAWKSGKEETPPAAFTWKPLPLLALATSLDALALGAGLALAGESIWLPALLMGVVTGFVSAAGVFGGRCFQWLGSRGAGIAGGAAIVLIGVRILWTHLA